MTPLIDYNTKLKIEDAKKNGRWIIQELDSEGKEAREFEPWLGTLDCKVFNLEHRFSLTHGNRYGSQQGNGNGSAKQVETIFGDLIPMRGDKLSMLGTSREVSAPSLRVQKAKKDNCYLLGDVAFESEFGDLDDYLNVYLDLEGKKFDGLLKLINLGVVHEVSLSLTGVSGFYAEHGGSFVGGFGELIKVLSGAQFNQLQIPKSEDLKPPSLSSVSAFSLELRAKKIPWNSKHLISERMKGWVAKQLEEGLPHNQTVEQNESLRASNRFKLHQELLREAVRYSDETGLLESDLEVLGYRIYEFLEELATSFQAYDSDFGTESSQVNDQFEKWQLWKHQEVDFEKIKRGDTPYVDRDALIRATAQYLALPIRNKTVDRTLVDSLIGVEVFEFSKQMFSRPKYGLDEGPLSKPHPLKRFLSSQIQSFLVIAALPITILLGLSAYFDYQANWPYFVSIGLAGTWGIGLLADLMGLPTYWLSDTKMKRQIKAITLSMIFVYKEITFSQRVSPVHLRELLKNTVAERISWPSLLYVLLDDIIAREKSI